MIQFECPKCRKLLRVKDEMCGRAGKCPQCHSSIEVPQESEVSLAELPELEEAPAAEVPPVQPKPTATEYAAVAQPQGPVLMEPHERQRKETIVSQLPQPPSDEPVWHYMVGQQKLGPLPTQTMLSMIESKGIQASTMVWRQGMPNWAPAGGVPEFAFSFSGGTVAQPQGPVLMAPQRRCACGYQGSMTKKWDSWVVPVAVVAAIFTFGLGLLILLVPKKLCCPQCGSVFE